MPSWSSTGRTARRSSRKVEPSGKGGDPRAVQHLRLPGSGDGGKSVGGAGDLAGGRSGGVGIANEIGDRLSLRALLPPRQRIADGKPDQRTERSVPPVGVSE